MLVARFRAGGMGVVAIVLFIGFVGLQAWVTGNGPQWLDIIITALASLIGGIFYVMFALSRQLASGSFDRNWEGRYTILIILGGLAGSALAFLIVQPAQVPGSNTPDSASLEVFLTRPLLALLGGFSARAVYRVLERLVGTVEALIKGSGEEMVAAQEREAQARAAAEALSSRAETVQQLLEVNARINEGANASSLRDEIDNLIRKLMTDLPMGSPQPPRPEGAG
jgi:hypothetical protein